MPPCCGRSCTPPRSRWRRRREALPCAHCGPGRPTGREACGRRDDPAGCGPPGSDRVAGAGDRRRAKRRGPHQRGGQGIDAPVRVRNRAGQADQEAAREGERGGPLMILSDEKTTHLSHLILNHVKNPANARLKVEEVAVLREIKRILAAELRVSDEVDALVRRRLASYSRPLAEGSPEWETLHRKTFEEEMRKRKKL